MTRWHSKWGECDFPAAILKGAIERGDGQAYFASLGAWEHYLYLAIERGWLVDRNTPTEAGRVVYETSGLADLPRKQYGRAYMWDWSRVTLPAEGQKV